MEKKNRHAVALGRKARGHTSPAKKRASAENGKKGGRPPRATQPTPGVPTSEEADQS